MTDEGWLDTPMHPLLGISMFVLGSVALVALGLWLTAVAFFL